MQKTQIQIGSCYHSRVSGRKVILRVDDIFDRESKKHGGYKLDGSAKPYKVSKRTIYLCTNLSSSKTLEVLTASKFQSEVS